MDQNKDLVFSSRRSQVVGRNGMVATSQPLATAVGIKILQAGVNPGGTKSFEYIGSESLSPQPMIMKTIQLIKI